MSAPDADGTFGEDMDPQRARDLLDRAAHVGSAARSGAGWPQIACLLGLGGVSSMFIVAVHLLPLTNEGLIWLPMVTMGLWIAILTGVMVTFTRVTKSGFGRRWGTAIAAWAITWVVAIVGSTTLGKGELWFTGVAIVALTVVTVAGAWREARQ